MTSGHRHADSSATRGDASGPIVFFDGDCGLCDRSIAWLHRRDHRGRLRFAPLRGETYAALDLDVPDDLSSLVLLDADGVHRRSDAALRALGHTGGVWSVVASGGRVIPRSIRDAVYAYIAARRMRWFGAATACSLESAASARLLP